MTALQVISPAGEVVEAVTADRLLAAFGITDLDTAQLVELAAFDERARELESIAKEARTAACEVLVVHLDRAGRWTQREGGYEVTSPSPEAGTTVYDTDALRVALADLIADNVITVQAAQDALETAWPTAAVPYTLLRRVLRALGGTVDQPDHEDTREAVAALIAAEPEPTYRQKPAGIARLRKLPTARDAIDACRVDVEPPRRVARVKRLLERDAA